jgi:hypothetical protein
MEEVEQSCVLKKVVMKLGEEDQPVLGKEILVVDPVWHRTPLLQHQQIYLIVVKLVGRRQGSV